MGSAQKRKQARIKRQKRIRKKITGSMERPRLCVYRSSRHMYAQLIDDTSGKTLAAASSLEETLKGNNDIKGKIEVANHVGKLIAERTLEKGFKTVVFDRNGFLYHGRVKAVSEGAREAGLIF